MSHQQKQIVYIPNSDPNNYYFVFPEDNCCPSCCCVKIGPTDHFDPAFTNNRATKADIEEITKKVSNTTGSTRKWFHLLIFLFIAGLLTFPVVLPLGIVGSSKDRDMWAMLGPYIGLISVGAILFCCAACCYVDARKKVIASVLEEENEKRFHNAGMHWQIGTKPGAPTHIHIKLDHGMVHQSPLTNAFGNQGMNTGMNVGMNPGMGQYYQAP